MHDHPISHLTDLKRRDFLTGAGIACGLLLLGDLTSAEAATKISLPGFSAFAAKVNVFKNGNYYMVESNGLPDHSMMVGIKSWQQQVPTPQPYTGANAWPIPIKPVISKAPITAKNHFLRGAIAIAANGVPIFNALNNRGDDAFLVGELDDWGGHCGRADDYHYHIAPLHLQQYVGAKAPIAYALDGFPIYGLKEPDGKAVVGLDEFNGHFDAKKKYHYHGTKTFPYINGGFRGKVVEKDGQVDPQAATRPFREAGAPLRGAAITAFEDRGNSTYDLKYELNNQTFEIRYVSSLTTVEMTFISPDGTSRSEVYQRR